MTAGEGEDRAGGAARQQARAPDFDCNRISLRDREVLELFCRGINSGCMGWPRGFHGCVMTSPKEYRDYALECVEYAAEAKDERLKEILMETAMLWMQAALEVEQPRALTGEHVPRPKKWH